MKVLFDKKGKKSIQLLDTSSTDTKCQYKMSFVNGSGLIFNDLTNNIIYGDRLYYYQGFKEINGNLPLLKTANYMFGNIYTIDSPLKEVSLSVPVLVEANYMFAQNKNLKSAHINAPLLTTAKSLFYHCDKLTDVEINAPLVTNASGIFRGCSEIETIDISNMTNIENISYGFFECTNLKSLNISLSKATNGNYAFEKCNSLTSINGDFSSLTTAEGMFERCESLETCSVIFGPLTNINLIFKECKNLKTFNGDMSLVTTTISSSTFSSFYDCFSLETFNSDLTNMEYGHRLFYNCISLANFSGKLSSLIDGRDMFKRCKLTLQSVQNILNTLINDNTYSGASTTPTITLGVDSTYKQDVINYLIQIGCATGEDEPHALSTILRTSVGQNWTLEINWN